MFRARVTASQVTYFLLNRRCEEEKLYNQKLIPVYICYDLELVSKKILFLKSTIFSNIYRRTPVFMSVSLSTTVPVAPP